MALAQPNRWGRRIAPTMVGTPIDTSGYENMAVGTGDHEVAEQHPGQPVADTGTVHSGDGRLEQLHPALEGVDRRLLPERAAEGADRALAVVEVGPGAEDAAVGRQDPDPGVLLVAEPVPGRVQVLAERAVDGVASLGAVEGDGGDVVFPPPPNTYP